MQLTIFAMSMRNNPKKLMNATLLSFETIRVGHSNAMIIAVLKIVCIAKADNSIPINF